MPDSFGGLVAIGSPCCSSPSEKLLQIPKQRLEGILSLTHTIIYPANKMVICGCLEETDAAAKVKRMTNGGAGQF